MIFRISKNLVYILRYFVEGRLIQFSPRKTSSCGVEMGLEIDVGIKPHDYIISEYQGYGVKVWHSLIIIYKK